MRQTFFLGTIATSNLVVIFLFQWYLMARLGPGSETDAFFAGATLPQIFLNVLIGPMMHALVPMFAARHKESLVDDAWAVLLFLALFFTTLGLLLGASANIWIPLVFPGFDPGTHALIEKLTHIQLIGMVFSAVNCAQWALHHSQGRFIDAELRPLFASAVSFGVLVVTLPIYGVEAAAWTVVLRLMMQTLLLARGFGKPKGWNWNHVFYFQVWHRIRPLLLSGLYYKSEELLDRYLLSTAAPGSLSIYHFALQIYVATNSIFNKAFSAPLMTRLSTLAVSGERRRFNREYSLGLFVALGATLLGFLVLLMFGQPLLSLLVGYGKFNHEDVYLFWQLLVCMGGILVAGTATQVVSAAYYAKGDTRRPAIIGAVIYTLYVPGKLYAFYEFGLLGLAVATSLHYTVAFVTKALVLRSMATQPGSRANTQKP